MAIGRPLADQADIFNSLYNITLDVSGWDKVAIQVVSPMSGVVYVYGSNDAGAIQGVTQGNAELAINFNPIQATNLSTGTATNVINSEGNYSVPINAQFLRLQGSPADTPTNVYKLLIFNSKIS
jgi:hypothetical protein